MDTRIKVTVGLLLLHLFTSYGSCAKKNCVDAQFGFAITNKIYPDNDSIQVGDTIWVEVDVPVKLSDLRTNKEVDYSGAMNLGTAVQFLKLGKGNAQAGNATEAAVAFKTVLVLGDVVDNSGTPFSKKVKEFLFKEINGRYRFKVGFIALEMGDFVIGPGNAAGVARFSDKCTKASFNITIADTDQHLYLYQQSRPGYEISPYERSHMYCVRVK